MDGGDTKKAVIKVDMRPMCICGHSTMYHSVIGGSSFRHACGKVGCPCKRWRPVGQQKSMNIHKKGNKS